MQFPEPCSFDSCWAAGSKTILQINTHGISKKTLIAFRPSDISDISRGGSRAPSPHWDPILSFLPL